MRDSGVPSLRGHAPHAARRRHAGAGEREDPGGRHPGLVTSATLAGDTHLVTQIIMDQTRAVILLQKKRTGGYGDPWMMWMEERMGYTQPVT